MKLPAINVRGMLAGGSTAPTYVLTRWVFLRLLGVVYFIAFASLAGQMTGLVGEHGILPAGEFLDLVRSKLGKSGFYFYPTLCWFSSSDIVLQGLCWGGAAVSLLLIAGIVQIYALILLWAMYLSLVVAGQTFLGFQWDSLLLETGLLAMFYAPTQFRWGMAREQRPSNVARWMLWWLLFRLMFLSGVTKLLSGDPTWRNGTALNYHFETQPIPTPLAWYAHHLPEWTTVVAQGEMFFVEIALPFLIFLPPRFRAHRHIACGLLIGLQLSIALTGNYGFFNWLTIILCLLMLDDGVLLQVVPRRLRGRFESAIAVSPTETKAHRVIVLIVAIPLFALSSLAFVNEIEQTTAMAHRRPRPERWTDPALKWVAPFRSINGYGLFRVMTTVRREIVIERSDDGLHWMEYTFRWQPGDVSQRPPFVAPYMPRLDWQMWFVPTNLNGSLHWLLPLLKKLAEGEPSVVQLLDNESAQAAPPRYLRLVLYEYDFSTAEEKRRDGRWWTRKKLGYLTAPLELTDPK